MDKKNQGSILIVDDNATNLRLLLEILKNNYKVYATLSGEKALAFLERTIPDLILLDIEMPGLNGYEVIRRIKSNKKWESIPVIFLTAQEGADNEERALKTGAIDYILKPITAGVVLSRVSVHMELENYKKNLENMVLDKTLKLEKTQDAILDILTSVTAFRDNETGGHIMRTTLYVKLLVDYLMQLNYPGYEISKVLGDHIIKCAKLHDIGKVAISDLLLLKPGRLSPDEYEAIKAHTVLGGEMIDNAIQDLGDESSFLYVAKDIVLYHHEHWNGKGYPMQLKGEEIPLSARIMAIADVYDALASHRPYKSSFTHQQSMDIIFGEEGHFDPKLLDLCRDVFNLFEYIGQTYNDEKFPVYSSEVLNFMFHSLEEELKRGKTHKKFLKREPVLN